MNSSARPSSLLQILQQVDDLRLDRHVERRDRLVADDQVGLGSERAGDADALALAAGELVRIAPTCIARQPRPCRAARATRVVDARRRLGQAEIAERLGQDVAHAHARVEAARTGPGRRSACAGAAAASRAGARARRCRCPSSTHLACRRVDQAQDGAADRRSCRSPTRRPAPATRPRAIENDTPSTAWTWPRRAEQAAADRRSASSGR